jgi:hypothetical protein
MDFTDEMERAATRLKDALVARIESGVPPPNAAARWGELEDVEEALRRGGRRDRTGRR